MGTNINDSIARQVAAQDAANDDNLECLRKSDLQERGRLLQSVCEAALVIHRSRLAAGLPAIERAPWPESTREFLRKQAANVQR
jgi:hypothetical protein